MAALGRGGLQVGPYGFGSAALGGLYEAVDEQQAHECLEAAWAAGLRYFDTAPHYGAGLSERRVGQFLASKPSAEWVLSTKVGRIIERVSPADALSEGFAGEEASRRVFDFSRDGIRRSLDASLERLGVDHIDIAYLHDPDDHWQQAIDEGWPALAQLRSEGALTSIGAGMKQAPMLARFVRETDMDVVLLAGRYTLLDQVALTDLLPACVERSTSVAIGGVFNSGVLANPSPDSAYDYGAVPADVLARVRRIATVCERHGVSMAAAAVQFPLAHSAVSTVLLGARSSGELHEDLSLAGAPLPAQLWVELRDEGLLAVDAPVPGG
jgi:D-threo-aldose 1-dehydrogenase